MRKFLLGTSAIVGVGMIAGPAAASERIKLGVGGYMEQYIGFMDSEEDNKGSGNRDFTNFDQQDDSEVYFSGSTTLDNGIKLAVRVELEANESATGIDEAYLNISSDTLGLLIVGGDDAAAALTSVSAPRGFATDYDNWVPAINITNNDNSYNTGNAGDANKLTYFTPRIAGLQVAASYVPEPGVTGNIPANYETDNHSAWSASVSYKEELMGVGVNAVVGTYVQGMRAVATPIGVGERNYNVGLQLSYQNFTLGGMYVRSTSATESNENVSANSSDGYNWDVGLRYKTGPYTVGLWYKRSELEGDTQISGEDEVDAVALWGEYQLGDGVKLQAMVFNVEYDEENNTDALEFDGGWGVVLGTKLDF